MRRIKLAIVATCTAVTAATITPAYAAEERSSLETLSTAINRYGVIEYAKMSVVSIFTLPLTLSLTPFIKPPTPRG